VRLSYEGAWYVAFMMVGFVSVLLVCYDGHTGTEILMCVYCKWRDGFDM